MSSTLCVQRSTRVFSLKPVTIGRITNARFESSQTPRPDPTAARKAAQDRADELAKDWDARVISYAELKPKAESPDPVSCSSTQLDVGSNLDKF